MAVVIVSLLPFPSPLSPPSSFPSLLLSLHHCCCPSCLGVVPLSSAIVLHLTAPHFHPASSCLQWRLGVLWWLVVVPGSSSSSCPLAVACTRLPPREQLLEIGRASCRERVYLAV